MSFNFSDFALKTQKTLTHTLDQVSALRIGGASIQMLDTVTVEAYGSRMKLNEVANISAPDPQTLMISPWDASLLQAVEKGVQTANLNLNPVVDGKIVRISVPPLTAETRAQLVKVLQQKIEDGRVMLRSIRAETKKDIEAREDAAGVSEDEIKRDLEELEKKVKEISAQLDELLAKKQAQLLKV
jgi:ribosome recycling factor